MAKIIYNGEYEKKAITESVRRKSWWYAGKGS